MTDTRLPHGQLPPIPEGCGILPVAENRIAHGPTPELLDVLPEGFDPLPSDGPSAPLNDAMEQTYRRVLSRAIALAASALIFSALVASSLSGSPIFQETRLGFANIIREIFVVQILIANFCSRYVEKLSIAPAAILLFCYGCFCALEFSALGQPAILAVAFLSAGLMYAVTSIWGFVRRADLANPAVPLGMIPVGGLILFAINRLLHTSKVAWTVSSIAVVIFAGLVAYFAQQIRDFYQDFDDDSADGWKASVLGALLLLVNSVNVLIFVASFLSRSDDDRDSTDNLPR